ncbi:unnamed protein product [Owenia fusiformis]|uniref:Uncharacterized protein n=1 Tax=Owenia fusiformis TaxID=6347 RepID=A0A8J1TV55_OWEFU|nr:unnamed protein product [Owenia fusiformis]
MKFYCSNTMISFLIYLFAGTVFTVEGIKYDLKNCDPKYASWSPEHSACISDRQDTYGITFEEAEYILSRHNYYRSNVHRFNNQPPAGKMMKMVWDDEIAFLAQQWAHGCIYQHDTNENRNIPGLYQVGQNLAWSSIHSWSSIVDAWQNEVELFKFGQRTGNNVGHYTQMVWDTSSRLGCGYALCNETKHFFVCNYGPAGNYVGKLYKPYEVSAKPGSLCGGSLEPSSRLCDCDGKVCHNGGKLNVDTCECQCPPGVTWMDDVCDIQCDLVIDNFICASRGGNWPIEYCKLYDNVGFQYCPITCGLCPYNETHYWGSPISFDFGTERDTTTVTSARPFTVKATAATTKSITTTQTSTTRKLTPSTPKLTPSTTMQTPSTVKLTPSTTMQAPSTVKLTPSTIRETPSTTKLTPSTTMQAPYTVKLTPSTIRETPSTTKLTPSTTVQTPSSTMQTTSTPQQTPSTIRQTPSTLMQTPSTTKQIPDITNQTPSITNQVSVTSKQTPVVTTNKAVTTMITPVVTNGTFATMNDNSVTQKGESVTMKKDSNSTTPKLTTSVTPTPNSKAGDTMVDSSNEVPGITSIPTDTKSTLNSKSIQEDESSQTLSPPTGKPAIGVAFTTKIATLPTTSPPSPPPSTTEVPTTPTCGNCSALFHYEQTTPPHSTTTVNTDKNTPLGGQSSTILGGQSSTTLGGQSSTTTPLTTTAGVNGDNTSKGQFDNGDIEKEVINYVPDTEQKDGGLFDEDKHTGVEMSDNTDMHNGASDKEHNDLESPGANDQIADGSVESAKTTPALTTPTRVTTSKITTPQATITTKKVITTTFAPIPTTTTSRPTPVRGIIDSIQPLSPCDAVEPAACGQPSGSYWPSTYCSYASVKMICPAMCGICHAEYCVDYEGNVYEQSEQWVTLFGRFTCTENGILHENGCLIDDQFIPTGGQISYIEGPWKWKCDCQYRDGLYQTYCAPQYIQG